MKSKGEPRSLSSHDHVVILSQMTCENATADTAGAGRTFLRRACTAACSTFSETDLQFVSHEQSHDFRVSLPNSKDKQRKRHRRKRYESVERLPESCVRPDTSVRPFFPTRVRLIVLIILYAPNATDRKLSLFTGRKLAPTRSYLNDDLNVLL